MERQNFYQGQSVAPEHLNKLQDFSTKGQDNLISTLLGYGVVNGFEISPIEGHIVGVTAGLAFNMLGERLVLAEGQQVNLAQYIPNVGDKTVKLGIIQNYIKTEPALDSMGNAEYTKWTPTVQFVTGETLEVGVFELAEIKINPVGVVEIKSSSACFVTLQKQIQNTSALNTTDEGATLQGDTLSLLAGDKIDLNTALMNLIANNSLSIESPLINLITQNLQINGTPYMEIGENDNGHYVKFECGLCIIIAIALKTNGNSVPFIYPISTITSPIILSTSVFNSANNLHTQWAGNIVRDWFYHNNYFKTTGYFDLPWTVYTFAIGFWK